MPIHRLVFLTLLSAITSTCFGSAEVLVDLIDRNHERLTHIYDQRLDESDNEKANAEQLKPKKLTETDLVENIRNKSCAQKLIHFSDLDKLQTSLHSQYRQAALHLIAVDYALESEQSKPYTKEIRDFTAKTIVEIDRHLSALLTYVPRQNVTTNASFVVLERELVAAISGYFLPLLRSEYILNSGFSETLMDRFIAIAEIVPTHSEVISATAYAAGIAREDVNTFEQVKRLVKTVRKSLENGPPETRLERSAKLALLTDYLASEVVGPLNFNPLKTQKDVAEFMRAVDIANTAGISPQEYLTGHSLNVVERELYLKKNAN